MSPCRSDCLFVTSRGVTPGVQSLRIPGDQLVSRFPADCPHRTDCHCPYPHPNEQGVRWTSTAGYSDVPAYSQVLQQPGLTNRYSSRLSPYRYGAWTISSSPCFKGGALRM